MNTSIEEKKLDNNYHVELNENINIFEVAKNRYSDDELQAIVDFSGTLKELDKLYPIECIRKYGDDGYRVVYLGREKAVILLCDGSANILYGSRVVLLNQESSVFTSLTENNSLHEVMQIDPYGDYLFLYTGRNDLPRESYHYTKDGYIVCLEYDLENQIRKIIKTLL